MVLQALVRGGLGTPRHGDSSWSRYVLYATVLPSYRRECVELLARDLGPQLALYASPAHLDRSVRTGIPADAYRPTRMLRLPGAYLQLGGWWRALAAESLVVDLNPRSITAWVLIVARRLRSRRTLVWGHLHSRSGPASRSAPVRRLMRQLASGFIAYTPGQAQEAVEQDVRRPVWVAPNALFSRTALTASRPVRQRTDVLYVGRLEAEKRVEQIVRAFALHRHSAPGTRLVLVGSGAEERRLRSLSVELGVDEAVRFAGWVDTVDDLREIYATAFCTVSPGFAGLGLTQSLGFGVPQLIADGPVHSPEIELAATPSAVRWFDGESVEGFARAMTAAHEERSLLPLEHLCAVIRADFSAESMASGLARALRGER